MFNESSCPPEERGNWIYTYTGKHYHVINPSIDEVDAVDISHALSMLCRWTGHCRAFYSVGQHCVYVSDWLAYHNYSKSVQYAGLLHDSPGAYIADLNRPLKHSPGLAGYNDIEHKNMMVIAAALGCQYPFNYEAIKIADAQVAVAEFKTLFPGATMEGWDVAWQRMPSLPFDINPWRPERARSIWMMRFKDLRQQLMLF